MKNQREEERYAGDARLLLELAAPEAGHPPLQAHEFKLLLDLPASATPSRLSARLRDVSRTGVGVQCEQPLAAGTSVRILLAPDDDAVRRPRLRAGCDPEPEFLGMGHVVHDEMLPPPGNGHRLGIRIDQADTARLEELIAKCKALEMEWAALL